MEGFVNTRTLVRSVLKHTDRARSGLGIDAAALHSGEMIAVGRCESGEYIGAFSTSEMAFIRALNNLTVRADSAKDAGCTMIMGTDVSEDVLRREMILLKDMAHKAGIEISFGDTGRSALLKADSYIITVTLISEECGSCADEGSKIIPGDRLIMAGLTGQFGAYAIASARKEQLRERFPESFIDGIILDKDKAEALFTSGRSAGELRRSGAVYIHDISFGGIYRAVYEASKYAGLGIELSHDSVPIMQEVIEVAEFYNFNPYELCGTGGLIAAVKSGCEESALESLRALGVPCAVIGRFTEKKETVVLSERMEMKRNIGLYEGDPLIRLREEEDGTGMQQQDT